MRVVPDEVWGPLNILAEARGEPFDGQVAVGFVTRERMRLGYFSDGSVLGTVWRPKQFSWTLASDKQRHRVMAADDEDQAFITAKVAWEQSEGSDILPPGTVLYHADYVRPGWATSHKVQFVRQIGRHLFYKLKEA